MEKLVLLLMLAWQCLANEVTTTAYNEKALTNYRLDDTITPIEYDINFILSDDVWDKETFEGTSKIKFTVSTATRSIRLHRAPEMSIDHQNIKVDGISPLLVLYDKKTEIMRIVLLTPLNNATEHTLEISSFIGKLYEDMNGFYISTYLDESGQEHKIATTQFQPTHARRAFPCFDEPRFKAVFKIQFKVATALGLSVLSNQEVSSTAPQGTDTVTVFAPTTKMSTYLIAFVVHDFAKVEVETNKYRIFAPSNLIATAEYAKSVTKPILEALNTFTNLDYWAQGMNQLDQVAIPDFSAGAMENWGLVTYRETALLWDESDSTYSNKQRVASVIAHEFAHMWFGNLVTLNWWSSTWLNEGFATYFECHTTAEVEEDFDMKNQFVIKDQQTIFQADSYLEAQPLTSDVQTPSEISAKFGSISYSKGGSILRMMERAVGLDKFKTSIQKYLAANKYKNTEPSELFKHFEAPITTDGLSMETVMENWVMKSGYPVVTVTLDGKNVKLNQERFLYSEIDNITQYYIPISYTTKTNPDFTSTLPKLWLKPDNKDVIIEGVNDDWIILNIQESGYYRVNYDDKLWERIKTELSSSKTIDPINRAQIVDDALNLARAGIIGYNTALDITLFLENETNYYPWYSAFQAFSYLRRRLGATEKEEVTSYLGQIMKKLYESVSFEVTDSIEHVDMLRTVMALQWACELDNDDCRTKSTNMFAQMRTKNAKVNPNLRSVVYCSALRHGNKEDWEFLWGEFGKTSNSAEQVTILTALGCSKDPAILKQYLEYSLDSTKIRKQDAYSVFTAVLTGNPIGVEVAFKFLTSKYGDIRNQYGSMNALSTVITSVADRLTTKTEVEEFEKFITENKDDLKDAAIVATAAIVTAKTNLEWVNKNKKSISSWIQEHNGGSATTTEPTTTTEPPTRTEPTTTTEPPTRTEPTTTTEPTTRTEPPTTTETTTTTTQKTTTSSTNIVSISFATLMLALIIHQLF